MSRSLSSEVFWFWGKNRRLQKRQRGCPFRGVQGTRVSSPDEANAWPGANAWVHPGFCGFRPIFVDEWRSLECKGRVQAHEQPTRAMPHPLKLSIASTLLVTALLATANAQAPGGRGPKKPAEIDPSKLPPAAKQEGVTFAKDIRPLFEASCFRCHGEERQKGDLRLDSLEAVQKGGEDGKILVAGNSAKSPLVAAISGLDEEHAMPPKRRGGPGGPGGPGRRGGPNGPGEGAGAPPKEGEAPQGAAGQKPPDGGAAGGPPGGGRPERGFGGPGGPGGGGRGPASKPLTPDQVGLVRAWIDQGAK